MYFLYRVIHLLQTQQRCLSLCITLIPALPPPLMRARRMQPSEKQTANPPDTAGTAKKLGVQHPGGAKGGTSTEDK